MKWLRKRDRRVLVAALDVLDALCKSIGRYDCRTCSAKAYDDDHDPSCPVSVTMAAFRREAQRR